MGNWPFQRKCAKSKGLNSGVDSRVGGTEDEVKEETKEGFCWPE